MPLSEIKGRSDIAGALNALRVLKGMSCSTASQALGVSTIGYGRLETGHTPASREHLSRMSAFPGGRLVAVVISDRSVTMLIPDTRIENWASRVGVALSGARSALGLTQQGAADAAGLSKRSVTGIEAAEERHSATAASVRFRDALAERGAFVCLDKDSDPWLRLPLPPPARPSIAFALNADGRTAGRIRVCPEATFEDLHIAVTEALGLSVNGHHAFVDGLIVSVGAQWGRDGPIDPAALRLSDRAEPGGTLIYEHRGDGQSLTIKIFPDTAILEQNEQLP